MAAPASRVACAVSKPQRHANEKAGRMAEERINAIGKIKLPTMGDGPRFLGRMRGQ